MTNVSALFRVSRLVRVPALCIAAAALLGQAAPPALQSPGAGPGMPPNAPATERVHWYALATNARAQQVPALDAAREPLVPVLSALAGEGYSVVAEDTLEVDHGSGTQENIAGDYELRLAVAPGVSQQNVALRTQLVEANASAREALLAEGEVPRGKPLVVRGLPRAGGELALVMLLEQPDSPPRQDQQSQDPQNNDQQEQDERNPDQQPQDRGDEQEQQPQPGDQDEQQGEQDAMQQENPANRADENQDNPNAPLEESTAPPQDLQNIEALLQSLEEVDKQQQRAQQRRRILPQRGDWW